MASDPEPGSGYGVSKGASYGTEAGRVHGGPSDPVLVVGIGYPWLGDLAVGNVVADRIAAKQPDDVAVADCSHTPIATYQTISGGDHDAVVLVGAIKRGGELNDGTPSEEPGRVRDYPARDLDPVDEDRLRDLVGEGAMGSMTVENVVAICRAFDALPEQAWVVEVEPAYDSWGMEVEEFSDEVGAVLGEVTDRVKARVDAALQKG